MHGRTLKRHPKWAVCAGWVANSGAWSFNLPKNGTDTPCSTLGFGSERRGKRCATGLEECKGITAKYHSLVFFPPPHLLLLSACCCFEAFPWEQWSGAGRCCCPWCRNSQTWWGRNTRRFFCYLYLRSLYALPGSHYKHMSCCTHTEW